MLTLQAPHLPTIELGGTPNISTEEDTVLSDFRQIEKYALRHKRLPDFLSSRYSAWIFDVEDYRNYLRWNNILRVDWKDVPTDGGIILFYGREGLLWVGDASVSIKKRLKQLLEPFSTSPRGRETVGARRTALYGTVTSTNAIKHGVTCVGWLTHTDIKLHGIRWFRDEFIKTYSPLFQAPNVSRRVSTINPSREITNA